MILMWFVYGLAFFTLGLAIFVYPKKPSIFKLAKHLWLIAGFGLLHGINEWLDMFIGIGGPMPPETLKLVRIFTLVGSFLFLLRFGTKVIVENKKGLRWLEALPIVLFVIWAVILALSSQKLLIGDVSARYLLCAPGTFLTSIALFMQIPQFKETKLRGVVRMLKLSAFIFLLYGIFAGLIVKKAPFFTANYLNYDVFLDTVGVRVQIFRAACAVTMAFSMTYVLSIFRWETQQQQKELSEYRQDMERKTRLAEVGTMGATMAQRLDEPLAITRLLLQRVLVNPSGSSPDEHVVNSLKKSLLEISKATEIVNSFQRVAQVSGKITANIIDLYPITKRIMAVFAKSAQQVNLTLLVKDVDAVLYLSIPDRQLEQVFFILVQNAVDNADVTKPQKLTIDCHLDAEQVEMRFSNTCTEIEEARLVHIFEPFFAVGKDVNVPGLSLTVAKQIICDYGGDIIAESKPGQGLIFRVILPIEQV